MRFTMKNLRFLQYIDYQNVRKTEFLGCQSQVCGYVFTRFQRLRTFAHGNVEQPAGRDLEYIIECQVDMMSDQMQVM